MNAVPASIRRAILAFAPKLFATTIAGAHTAKAQAQARIVIRAPIERVWALLADVTQWPQWNPAVQSVTLRGSFANGACFVWKSQGFTVTSTLQDVQPMRTLSWTGRAMGTRAFHAWHLETTPDGVVVRTEETFDGWLPWLIKGSMQKKLDETLPLWLETLRRVAESTPHKTQSAALAPR